MSTYHSWNGTEPEPSPPLLLTVLIQTYVYPFFKLKLIYTDGNDINKDYYVTFLMGCCMLTARVIQQRT